jgi:hypothetical protein
MVDEFLVLRSCSFVWGLNGQVRVLARVAAVVQELIEPFGVAFVHRFIGC